MPDRSSAMTCRCTGQSIHHFQLYFVLLLSACATSQHAHASRQSKPAVSLQFNLGLLAESPFPLSAAGLSQTQLKYLLILEPNLHLTELGQVCNSLLVVKAWLRVTTHSVFGFRCQMIASLSKECFSVQHIAKHGIRQASPLDFASNLLTAYV